MRVLIALLISVLSFAGEIKLVVDRDYFPTLMQEIGNAKSSIKIIQFSFAAFDKYGNAQTDREPYQIALKLIEKKKANPQMEIKLFIEGERDTAIRNKITAKFLEDNGIEVVYGATHAKGYLFDEKTILFGSTNHTSMSMRNNNETNVLLKGFENSAKAFNDIFKNHWNKSEQKSIAYPADQGVQILSNGVYKERLLEVISSKSTQELDFSIYYFSSTTLTDAFIDAHNTGVTIRGLFNQFKGFGEHLVIRNKKTYDTLKAAGLDELFFDQTHFFSHSKFLIQNSNRVLLGTGNWNYSDFNKHPQIYVDITDESFARELKTYFESILATETAPYAL